MPAGSGIRDDITRALRGILSNWIETQHASGSDDAEEEAAIAFGSATPDQVFDFLDKEIRIQGSF
jgi:polyketide synthase 12